MRRSLGGTSRRRRKRRRRKEEEKKERSGDEEETGLRGTGWDVRPDGQLASLFRLQPTPDDICGNKTHDAATQEGYICILSPTMMMKRRRRKKIKDYISGFR